MVQILAIIGFFFFSLESILLWVGLWQTKEYRLDRFLVHLKETRQGRYLIFSPTHISLWLLIALYIAGVFVDKISFYFPFLVMVFFLVQTLSFLRRIVEHRVKRPQFTLKSLVVCLLSFSSIVVLYIYALTDILVWLIILSLIIPFITSLYVFFFSFPTEIYTDYLIQKAKHKLEELKQVTVIAVSGSYGKSSTKEIIAHVLSQKYSVVKTSLSNNTPIAIAKTILNSITGATDFFVVEMGAYKKGEIAQLSSMVKPDVSVTTAVSDQHLSLYGGLQEVIDSEMELIREIPKKGLSVFNGNSPYMKKLIHATHHKKIVYQTKQALPKTSTGIVGFSIIPKKNGVAFSVKYKDKLLHLASPLLGLHTVENILPAVYLGMQFGVSDEAIAHAIKTLRPLPKTMVSKVLSNKSIGIDDTFNASPESVFAAANYLALFKKKKIFVLTPLIELGKKGKERHIEIGKLIAPFDYVFLTNNNFFQEIKKGIRENNGTAHIEVASIKKIAEKILQLTHKDDAIIFEGKEAGFVLKYLQ